jgi:murein DD-endopeptidase MepM/ murein hydrolase activator NlpD
MLNFNFIFFILIFIFIIPSVDANTLYDLEKMHFENELKRQNLANDIENSKIKIELNISAIQERKLDLVRFLKADQQLDKFQFGGLMAIKDWPLLKRNLTVFAKIKQQNLNALRELKYYSADLSREQKNLNQKNESLDLLNKKILSEEKKLIAEEKQSLENILSNNKDSLLVLKGRLSVPIVTDAVNSSAKVKLSFGPSRDLKNQYILVRKGITYQANPTQIIQAIGPGKIIFRDHIKYWGESVIIQHAGDYYSVYTNLKNCIHEVNDTIEQSEKIGDPDSDEFYFELRNQNVAIDPQKWIRN